MRTTRWLLVTIFILAAAVSCSTAAVPHSPIRTVESKSSLFGVGLFIVWLLLVAVCLWQAAGTAAPESEAKPEQ